MPVVTVYGVPPETPVQQLEKMINDLQFMIAGAKTMNIEPSDVSVFFPSDLVRNGLGEEIIVFISGIYNKPERTQQVLRMVARRVGDIIKRSYFPNAMVEVFAQPVDSVLCWSSQETCSCWKLDNLMNTHCPIHGTCNCCHGCSCPIHDEREHLVRVEPDFKW